MHSKDSSCRVKNSLLYSRIMELALSIVIVLAFLLLLVKIFLFRKKKLPEAGPLPQIYRSILAAQVDFYNQLSRAQQVEFENRMQSFLTGVKITGVNTPVEDLDRVLIAASAIIPIFAFPDWEYPNLNEVLLYPEYFNDSFAQQGPERDTMGLVGSGPFQNLMILSKKQLREDFENKTSKGNTAVHEFVHLVDKTDGDIDGIPESLLSKQYVLPWLNLMHETIKKIMENRSDINPYGATNEAEFFAVVSEYFFERPDLLRSQHPELYDLLVTIFKQQPQPR